jgi:Yip1 domain
MTDMTAAHPVPPPEEKPLSEVERVVDTYIAPSKTFTDIRRSANWLMPVLLLIIATEALVFVADRKVGFAKMAENGLALQPKAAARLDQLPPDKRAEQMQVVVKITAYSSYLSFAIVIVFLLIVSVVLLMTFSFGMGAELTFNQCTAVVMYASLPLIVKNLLAILALAIGSGEGFLLQNPLASNPSGLVDPSSHFLYSLATQVDLFMIWTLVLAGIGFACVTRKKQGTCLGVVFGWWAIWVLGISGVSAAFA